MALTSSALHGKASLMRSRPALGTGALPYQVLAARRTVARSLHSAVRSASAPANCPSDLLAPAPAAGSPALVPASAPAAAPPAPGFAGLGSLLPSWVARAARLACMAALAASMASLLSPAAALAAGDAAATAAAGSSNPLAGLVSFILHLDKHLAALIAQHGANSVYALLFAIVFAETGLVLTPFLPGDSLLFAAGAFAGMGQLDVVILCAVFIVSAILGDAVNYAVGSKVGKAAVNRGVVSREHIAKTEKFYDKYGGKTVVLARFVPIVRTFAPFVAGIGSMPYGRFAAYNVGGALLWTFLFVGAGFFFGNLPFVRKNFTLVVLGIVAVSVVPVIYELWAARQEAAAEAAKGGKGGEEGQSGSGGKPNFA